MLYNEKKVDRLHEQTLSQAQVLLSSLTVAEGREPRLKGLTGWVFEQTIRYCLARELEKNGIAIEIQEQVSLGGRAKIDLLVGKAAIEIKSLGVFGNEEQNYRKYRDWAEEKGWTYMYLTRNEKYKKYKGTMESVFGQEYAFFLDTPNDWQRFVDTVVAVNGEAKKPTLKSRKGQSSVDCPLRPLKGLGFAILDSETAVGCPWPISGPITTTISKVVLTF